MATLLGCNDTRVGRRLTAKSIDFPHPTTDEKRMDMYAFLELIDEDKEKLERWNLAPSQKSRPDWWTEYKDAAELYNSTDAGEHSPLWKMETFNQRSHAMKGRKEARDAKKRASTVQVRGQRQRVGSTQPSGSGFWITGRINRQERNDGATASEPVSNY
jgi:hypothetical protein